jgi:3-hydroxymyristoyl/3-hydroxydecanoyl-(acyl carrier protein) dehydratase
MTASSNKWLPLRDVHTTPEGRWEANAQFGSSSEWFSGHFEGYPLLPGVTLLALAAETVKIKGQEEGRILGVLSLLGVRFKHFVFPGSELLISIAAMPPFARANLDFQITCRDEVAAQGVLIVTENAPGE